MNVWYLNCNVCLGSIIGVPTGIYIRKRELGREQQNEHDEETGCY